MNGNAAAPAAKVKTRSKSKRLGESRFLGLLYISPWIIGFLTFTLYPIITSFFLSFTDYNLLNIPKFIGINNYIDMFHDKVFLKALAATGKYVILEVPMKLVVSLLVAVVLNMKIRGINFFRTAYYIPSILGSNVAIAILWKFLFSTDGLINQTLTLLGLGKVSWFGEVTPALFTIVLLRVWEFGSTMLIFLAALKGLPTEVYEAALVDGSNKVKSFFRITIPLLSPVIFFNFVMQLIQAFQEFNAPYLVTGGGPMKGTYLLPMLIYDQTFKNYNMGYASAMSWILFVLVMIFTMLTFRGSKYWVFYSDNGGNDHEEK